MATNSTSEEKDTFLRQTVNNYLQNLAQKLEGLRDVKLKEDFPNIHNVLQNRIDNYLPELYLAVQQNRDARDLQLHVQYINNEVYFLFTLIEAAVHMYQMRNVEESGLTRETMYSLLACVDKMLSAATQEVEITEILEKMVYFGLAKGMCYLFQKGWVLNYRFRSFLDRLIYNAQNQTHKEFLTNIKTRLTYLCVDRTVFTLDSCSSHLNICFEIMQSISQLFHLLLTSSVPTDLTGLRLLKVPVSANEFFKNMEQLENVYLASRETSNKRRWKKYFGLFGLLALTSAFLLNSVSNITSQSPLPGIVPSALEYVEQRGIQSMCLNSAHSIEDVLKCSTRPDSMAEVLTPVYTKNTQEVVESTGRFIQEIANSRPDLKAALYAYTGNAYTRLNTALRNSRGAKPTFTYHNERLSAKQNLEELQSLQRTYENIETVFSMVEPTTKPITVYRGVKRRKYVLENLVDGVGFEPSYLSTSVNKKLAIRKYTNTGNRQFVSGEEDRWCCLIQYTVMPGTKALYLESLTVYAGEEEILLQRNGTVVLTGFEKRNPARGIDQDTFYITFYPPVQ